MFKDEDGVFRAVSADNPLPTAGSGGGGGAVESVNGKTGAVVLTSEDIDVAVDGVAIGPLNDSLESLSETLAELVPTVAGKADANHTHTASNITDFNAAADARITASTTVVKTTGNQTVAGVKTFSSAPVVPDGSFSIEKTSGLQTALDGKVGSATVTALLPITQEDYDALAEKDPSVLYLITE